MRVRVYLWVCVCAGVCKRVCTCLRVCICVCKIVCLCLCVYWCVRVFNPQVLPRLFHTCAHARTFSGALTLSLFLVRARSESLPLSLRVHTLRSPFHTLSFCLSLTETLSLLPSHALTLVSLLMCLSFHSESFSVPTPPPLLIVLARS